MQPVLVVVPTYNEAANVERLAREVLQACPVDLLFVDDNSPDGTGELVDALAEQLEPVSVLHRPDKSGLGPAYLAGFRWGLAYNYAFVLQMDADLSHDPTDVPRLLETARTADLVLGSRYLGRLDRVRSSGYSFQIEMTHRVWMSGFSVVDIPITFKNRQLGRSKMNNRIITEAIWTVWKLVLHARQRRPRASS